MMKDFLTNLKIKILQTAIIIFCFHQISSLDAISNCNDRENFNDNNCFNNLITLTNCRAGQFAEDKYGNLFILYSKDNEEDYNRLFYGLNKDGTSYFPNSPMKDYTISNGNGDRDSSRIIFLNQEGNTNKEYLLSTSSGDSTDTLTELYEIGKIDDLKNGITNSDSGSTENIWNVRGTITSTQYSLIKIPDENKYFFIFAQYNTIGIIKFSHDSPAFEGFHKTLEQTISNNFNIGVISSFLIEEEKLLVLFYMNQENQYNYSRIYYKYDSDSLDKINEEVVPKEFAPIEAQTFFKGIYLKNNYIAYIYATGSYSYNVYFNISVLRYDSDVKYYFEEHIKMLLEDYQSLLIEEFTNNEFIKINDNRLAFLTLEDDPALSGSYVYLLIILFDISGETNEYVKINNYRYLVDFTGKPREISAYIYNGFLVFSATIPVGESSYNSILAFFGYPNGTDHSISIYDYLRDINDIGTDENTNIFKYLMNKMKLENNIFNYQKLEKINLVSMSREILFYNISEDGQEIGPLSANSFFEERHVLKQNLHLRRTNQDYYFDYQYIVKEGDNSEDSEDSGGSDNGRRRRLRKNSESEASSKLYYGRINRLTFKLCEEEEGCESECSLESYLNKECVSTGTNEEVIESVKGIISLYDDDSKILSIGLSENAFVEITNEKKDKLLDNDGNLAKIDLGECGEKIRESIRETTREYTDQPLIILKYGVSSDVIYENYVVYEIYNPITHAKIDISEICANLNVGVYIDTKMSKSVSKSVEEMVDQGYNPFDPNDKFYREICTPYDSPDGTDVLLEDREEYFLNNLNTIACADNCKTSSYPLDSRYLKCDCPVENEVTLDIKHFSGDNLVKSFKSTLKNSNWRAMNCYKLVFDKDIFGKNAGSILTLILFIIYVGFFVYYIFEGITPLQDTVAGMMSAADDNKEEAEKDAQDKEKSPAVISFKNPPKKSNSENEDNKDKKSSGTILDKKENDIQIVSRGSDKKERASVTDKDLSKIHIKKDSVYTEEVNLYRRKETEKEDNEEKYKDLDDFQLNNLEYVEACKYDKRTFLKTYWSVLKREHIILFTFVSRNDHNLFYVKIERFIILLCTQLFMNGLFFTDDSMHKTTQSKDYNFGQQLPKIIFSLICTHVIEVFLCYLSMTDIVIYEIKDLSKRKHTEQIIAEKINTMKKKLIAYFIVSLALFIFYWYFVSAFCAVFQNTQKAFLLDFLIGTIISFADPFIIYLLKVALRYLSLAKLKDRKGAIVYKISDLIPIF